MWPFFASKNEKNTNPEGKKKGHRSTLLYERKLIKSERPQHDEQHGQ